MRGGRPKPNSWTVMPDSRAVTKCPSSWMNIITLKMGRNQRTFMWLGLTRDHNNRLHGVRRIRFWADIRLTGRRSAAPGGREAARLAVGVDDFFQARCTNRFMGLEGRVYQFGDLHEAQVVGQKSGNRHL